MEFLGIGPIELLFIVAIALIVINPKDWQKTGRTLGEWLNKIGESDGWKSLRALGEEAAHLPTRLRREAYFEKYLEEQGLTSAPTNGRNRMGTWFGNEKRSNPNTEDQNQPQRSRAHYPSLAAVTEPTPETVKKTKKRAPAKKSPVVKKARKPRAAKPLKRGRGKKSNA